MLQVATTQWKKLLATLSGRLPTNFTKAQLDQMKLNAHDGRIHHFLSDLPPAEIRRRLETYTSFMFVRHPLERLVSGFREKFNGSYMNNPFVLKSSVEMIAHSQDREAWEVAQEGRPSGVTFEQFARWVADAPPVGPDEVYPGGPNDGHWRSMSELCHPCAIPYTFLGRFETMEEDARLLLKKANVSYGGLLQLRTSNTAALTGHMVESLSPETLRRVLRHYLEDLALFGYRPEAVFSDFSASAGSVKAMFESMLTEM